uniref:FTH domain-containing protein n=1 Tax=Panagrellus redivivus TaxID=6233 RepID=A0A7E5A0G4_PANRE
MTETHSDLTSSESQLSSSSEKTSSDAPSSGWHSFEHNLYFKARSLNGVVRYSIEKRKPENDNYPLENIANLSITDTALFIDVPAGSISKLQSECVYFFLKDLELRNSTFTPNELKYLLSQSKLEDFITINCKLIEAMNFSEIWPYIAGCRSSMHLSIENLVYDENYAPIVECDKSRITKFACARHFNFDHLPKSFDILKLIDFLMATHDKGTVFHLNYSPETTGEFLRLKMEQLKLKIRCYPQTPGRMWMQRWNSRAFIYMVVGNLYNYEETWEYAKILLQLQGGSDCIIDF